MFVNKSLLGFYVYNSTITDTMYFKTMREMCSYRPWTDQFCSNCAELIYLVTSQEETRRDETRRVSILLNLVLFHFGFDVVWPSLGLDVLWFISYQFLRNLVSPNLDGLE